MNILINFLLMVYPGQPYSKNEFVRILGIIRKKVFNQRIIREAFRDRGIWPVDGTKVLDTLAAEPVVPDRETPDEDASLDGPSNGRQHSSSPIPETPPTSDLEIDRNYDKMARCIHNPQKLLLNIHRAYLHQLAMYEDAFMTRRVIERLLPDPEEPLLPGPDEPLQR